MGSRLGLLPAIAPVDTFSPGVTSSFSFLSLPGPDVTSFLCNLFVYFLATPFAVALVDDVADVDDVAICPSSTKLVSSSEAGVLTPGPWEQVGDLKMWIEDPQQKVNCPHLHLPHRMLQRIGVMRTKVAGLASSPSSSTVVSREASNLLNIREVILVDQDGPCNTYPGLLVGGSLGFLLTIVRLKSIQSRMLTTKMAMKGFVIFETLPFLSRCSMMSIHSTMQMPEKYPFLPEDVYVEK